MGDDHEVVPLRMCAYFVSQVADTIVNCVTWNVGTGVVPVADDRVVVEPVVDSVVDDPVVDDPVVDEPVVDDPVAVPPLPAALASIIVPVTRT
jgi:hypothetical protein